MKREVPHTHPGQTIKYDSLAELGLSTKDAAAHGVDLNASSISSIIAARGESDE